MIPDLTKSSREKVHRADEHIGYLDERIQRFLKAKPYRVEPDPGPNPGQVRLRAFVLKEVPSVEWGTVVGEIVHDLRSALDQLVWALTIHDQKRMPREPLPPGSKCWWRHVSFPIYLTEPRWNSGHKANLRGVRPEHWDFFKSVQPFSRGKTYAPELDELWLLQELWNRDKHRAIPLVVAYLELRPAQGFTPEEALFELIYGGPDPEFGSLNARIVKKSYGPVEDGKVFAQLRLSVEVALSVETLQRYVNKYARAAFDIAFDKGAPAHGAGVRHALRELSAHVWRIITIVEGQMLTPRHVALSRSHCPDLR